MKIPRIISLVVACAVVPFYSRPLPSLQSIKNYVPFLSKKEATEAFNKEFPFESRGTITVKNSNGAITINAWNQDKVSISATKRAPTAEQLSRIEIPITQTATTMTIPTACQEKDCKVDYTLLVPANVSVNVTTDDGAIAIIGVKGKITATTTNGDINAEHTNNTVVAHALTSGSIAIKQAKQYVKAETKKGNIVITNSYNSVLATAENGNIDVRTAAVPSTSKIRLVTNTGLINLLLPHDVDADLQASTKKGAVICQHAVTIKPKTTTLDSKAWRQFKAQVDGILGSGEATIVLSTNRGNIKILDEKKA